MPADVGGGPPAGSTFRERLQALAWEYESLEAQNLQLRSLLGLPGGNGNGESPSAGCAAALHHQRFPAACSAEGDVWHKGSGGASDEEELLPSGWESAWDDAFSSRYYFCRATGERTWRRPTGTLASPGQTRHHAGLGNGTSSPRETGGEAETRALLDAAKLRDGADAGADGASPRLDDGRPRSSYKGEVQHDGDQGGGRRSIGDHEKLSHRLTTGPGGQVRLRPHTWTAAAVLRAKLVALFHWWDDLEEPRRTGCISAVVGSVQFKILCFCVIILNGISTFISTDTEIRHWQLPQVQARHWDPEIPFVSFYVLELLLKLLAHRLYFFVGRDARWNIFDLVLVALSGVDLSLRVSGVQDRRVWRSITFLRTLRLLQISRLLNAVRGIRRLKELRLMVASLVGCVCPTVFWAIIVLAFILHLFALIFVQGITESLHDGVRMDQETVDALLSKFGSVPWAMISLWKATTSSTAWGDYFDLLGKAAPWMSYFMMFFVFFFQVAIFNVLTAIFVENAIANARPTLEEQLEAKQRDEVGDARALLELCRALDADRSDTISYDDFLEHMAHPDFVRYFALRGLSISDARSFFHMLAAMHGSDVLDVGTFVSACLQLRGQASSLDVRTLGFEMKLIAASQLRCQELCRRQLEEIRERVPPRF